AVAHRRESLTSTHRSLCDKAQNPHPALSRDTGRGLGGEYWNIGSVRGAGGAEVATVGAAIGARAGGDGYARSGQVVDVQVLAVQIGRDIAGLFAALKLVEIGRDHPALDVLAAFGVDWVGDVGVQLEAAVAIAVLIAHEAV